MDKLLGSLDTLRWDRPGSTEESSTEEQTGWSPGPRRCWKDTEEMPLLTHRYRPGVCRPWRDPTRKQRERHLNVGQGGRALSLTHRPHLTPSPPAMGWGPRSGVLGWPWLSSSTSSAFLPMG